MLHKMDAVGYNTRNQKLIRWKFHLLPDLPFVLMPRVSRFDQISACSDLQHQIDKMLQLEVVNAGRNIHAITSMKPHSVLRYASQRVIDCFYPERDELPAFIDARIRRSIVVRSHPGIVNL